MATPKKEANEDIEIFDEQQVLFEEKNVASEGLFNETDDSKLIELLGKVDESKQIPFTEAIRRIRNKLSDEEKIMLSKLWDTIKNEK